MVEDGEEAATEDDDREDVDEVMRILNDVATTLQEDPKFGPDILEPLEMLGVDRFADSGVIIKCRITTKPVRQWAIGREMNRRIKKTFDAKGIEIPFPHRTLYWGTDQLPQHLSGQAPATTLS